MPGPKLQVLTPLTRGVNENRRRVFGGVEVRYATMLVLLMAFLPAFVLALLLFPLLGSSALLVFLAVEVAAYWLFRGRSRQGLALRNWETIRDRRRSDVGQWYMCDVPFDPAHPELGTVMLGNAPAEVDTTADQAMDRVLGRPTGASR